MTTQVLNAPETGVNPLIAIRRQLIVEKACGEFNTTLEKLRAMRSSEQFKLPWFTLCGLIAYLLKRDTDANNKEVAGLIDCNEFDVGIFIRDINRGLSGEADPGGGSLRSRMRRIVEAVQAAVDNNERPAFRFQERRVTRPPTGTTSTWANMDPDRITDAVLKEAEHLGINLDMLTSNDKKHDVVEVRDVWIFLLKNRTGLKDREITDLTKRDGTNLQNAALRMKIMSPARREFLIAVRRRLGNSS